MLGKIDANSVSQTLSEVFACLGWELEILTDSGANFLSNIVEKVWDKHGMKHLVSVLYHHQSNGLVERFSGTLGNMIKAHMLQNTNSWD